MRALVVGGVTSTSIVIDELLRSDIEIAAVLGYSPSVTDQVSGWADLASQCERLSLKHHPFVSVNSQEPVQLISGYAPDVIFAVGLSQLIGDEILNLPHLGVVGFHPTQLPSGRGRAPMAWLIESGEDGAATFFEMTPGADEGRIFVQEPFEVRMRDHAEDVYRRLYDAMKRALRRWLPRLRSGDWLPEAQDSEGASYWGKRTPADGLIDWDRSVAEIDALVRAASSPHPGAYTYMEDILVRVPQSFGADRMATRAFPGTVMAHREPGVYIVQANDGAIRLQLECSTGTLRLGGRLGYNAQTEIHALRKRINRLEAHLGLQ